MLYKWCIIKKNFASIEREKSVAGWNQLGFSFIIILLNFPNCFELGAREGNLKKFNWMKCLRIIYQKLRVFKLKVTVLKQALSNEYLVFK